MNNTEIKAGTIFGFKRPSGLAGAHCNRNISLVDTDISKLNLRGGLGNYDITRNNFVSSDIKPRMAGDFDKLQAIDIETQGREQKFN